MKASHTLLVAALVLRLAASLWYSAAFPAWETLDEVNHFRYVVFIAANGRLPTQADATPLPDELRRLDQFDQPPLAYTLYGVAVSLGGIGTMTDTPLPAPPPSCPVETTHYFIEETTPPQTERARRIVLGVNVLLGLVAVWLVRGAARQLSGSDDVANLAAVLLALYPPGIALGAWTNNDFLLIPLGAGVLWAGSRVRSLWDILPLFVAAALATATKITGMVTVVTAAVVAMVLGGRRVVRVVIVMVLMVLLTVIAWNSSNCGLPLCRNYLNHQSDYLTWWGFRWAIQNATWGESLAQLVRTAVFPVVQNSTPAPLWAVLAGLGVFGIGVCGVIVDVLTGDRRGLLLAFLLLLLAFGLGLFRVFWLPLEAFFPVRYLAVAIPAAVYLIARSYDTLARLFGDWLRLVPVGWVGLTLLIAPPLFFTPLTAPPAHPPQPTEAMPVTFDGVNVEVVGYSMTDSMLWIGFRAVKPIDRAMYARVVRLSENGAVIGECGEVLGTGAHPPMKWEPGEVVWQPFGLPLGDGPFALQLYAVDQLNPMLSAVGGLLAEGELPVQKMGRR